MSENIRLDDQLHCIDLGFQGEPGVIAAYLYEDSGERALIEIGPTSTLDNLVRSLEEMGVDPASISKLLVTHVHLDHAGAAGSFMRRFRGARLFVHESGVRHLVDPSKLVASATRIYGDRMDALWGAIDPVPSERITALTDGDTITIGGRRLDVVYTPGHASHHVAFHDAERRMIFTGDVAAVRLQGHEYVRPPTPPPDINLELWAESIKRLRLLDPETLCLTHYGPFTDVDRHLTETHDRLFAWAELVQGEMESGLARDTILTSLRTHANDELRRDGHDGEAISRYELASPYSMTVDGYLRYFQRRASS